MAESRVPAGCAAPGGADRFVPSHEEADSGEIRVSQTAPHLHLWSCMCPGSAAPWSSPDCSHSASCFPHSLILLRDLSKLSCQYFICFLCSSSQDCQSPNPVPHRLGLDLFCPNHLAWTRPGSLSALLLKRAPFDPPAKARASSSSSRGRAAHSSHCLIAGQDGALGPLHLQEVNLWQRSEKHFSATVLGEERKSGEDLSCWRVFHGQE